MARLKELMEQRAKLVADARALNEKAESEKRALTTEEQTNFDKMLADAEGIKARIDQQQRLEAEERDLERSNGRKVDPERPAGRDASKPCEYRYKLRNGAERSISLPGAADDESRAAFRRILAGSNTEIRALQAGSAVDGGYISAAQEFVAQLISDLDDAVFIRGLASTFTTNSNEGIGVPSLDTDMDDGTWTGELLTGSEDTALRFGKRELKPHPLAKRVKVSRKLVRCNALSIDAIVRQRLAYKMSLTQEKGFLTGTGVNQPLGVFTASNDGIPTTRDVSTGNTTTEIRFDGLIEAKYTLKAPYWPTAQWGFGRTAVKQIAKLKDGDGQYIWQPSVQAGQPDRVLGFPMFVSEHVPATFTTGLYVGILGDFSNYWIVDAMNMEIQVLNELYAETNQYGYIVRSETDGMPVKSEAFVRVKLA
jgi:HK97 family phage major capsid protein